MKQIEIRQNGLNNFKFIVVMKNLKILIALTLFMFIGVQQISAQEKDQQVVQEKVYKTTKEDVPSEVQETLKKYSNYTISKEATFTKKGNETLYRFKLKKGIWVDYLIVDNTGKVRGLESGEGDK